MQVTPEHAEDFASAQGAPAAAGADIIAGLSELATEIDLFRRQAKPRSDDLPHEVDKKTGAPLLSGAFILGLVTPLLTHAPCLSLGSALKILLLSAGLAQFMAMR